METENLILKIYQETGVWVPDGKREISESWYQMRKDNGDLGTSGILVTQLRNTGKTPSPSCGVSSMGEQPKEYIITEEQLDHFVTCATHDDCTGCKYSAPEFSCVPRIMANKVRSRPAPQQERIGSIRTPILQEDAYLIERVNAGMGEWEYVIQYCGEYYATAPTENIARDIVERAQWTQHQPPTPAALDVIEDIWKFCLINGAEEHGDLIGAPSKDAFFTLKLLKKIAEARAALRAREAGEHSSSGGECDE